MSIEHTPVRSWARPFVALLGGREATEGLWHLLGLTFFATVATSAFYSFVGIWAVGALHATPSEVGWLLLANAVLAIVSGFAGGVLSDRIGRKPVLVTCLAGQAVFVLCCSFVGDNKAAGFALVAAASTIGTPGSAARNSLVPDLVGQERRSHAYSSLRIVNNLAVVLGPAVIGGMLLVADWWAVFLVLGVVALGSAAFAQVTVPGAVGRSAARKQRQPSFWLVLRDGSFLAILGATLLALMIYVAYAERPALWPACDR
jgi:predicted MFS family arabinose efflux permease